MTIYEVICINGHKSSIVITPEMRTSAEAPPPVCQVCSSDDIYPQGSLGEARILMSLSLRKFTSDLLKSLRRMTVDEKNHAVRPTSTSSTDPKSSPEVDWCAECEAEPQARPHHHPAKPSPPAPSAGLQGSQSMTEKWLIHIELFTGQHADITVDADDPVLIEAQKRVEPWLWMNCGPTDWGTCAKSCRITVLYEGDHPSCVGLGKDGQKVLV